MLNDETRKRIMRAYRRLLSAPDATRQDEEIAERLPLNVATTNTELTTRLSR